MLWGTFFNHALSIRDTSMPADELLAYDLTPPHYVELGLAPKSDEFRLTTWCIVGRATPEERFDYVIRVDWLAQNKRPLGSNHFAFQSRVSAQPTSIVPSNWSVRLAYSTFAVTDSRTIVVKIPKFLGLLPAIARLSLEPQGNDKVLVRATYPEPRQTLEMRAVHESLSADERRALVENIASVSFDELPWKLRSNALSSWQRRLDAAGIEGNNFFVTRLLIGTLRSSSGLVAAQQRQWFSSKSHALAYNLKGPINVDITAKPLARLTVLRGDGTSPSYIDIGESGRTHYRLGHLDAPHTITITSDESTPTPISITLSENQLSNTFGNVISQETNDDTRQSNHYELIPMLRRSVYYALRNDNPVTISIADDQTLLGLRVRASAKNPRGTIEARFGNERISTTLTLTPSMYEQWYDESQATDVQNLYLHIPKGIREVQVFGDTSLAVAPYTYDPEIAEYRLASPFDVALREFERWSYPHFDTSREVALRPVNADDLTMAKRSLELLAQSRIVSRPSTAQQPNMVLSPKNNPIKRHVMEPYVPTPGVLVPKDVVIAIDPIRGFVVPTTGARSGRIRLTYRLAPTSIGNELEFNLDDKKWFTLTPHIQAEERELSLEPGTHRLSVIGLGEADRVLVEAVPVTVDGTLRRRVTHRLEAKGKLAFSFNKTAPNVRVSFLIFSEHERLFQFDLNIDNHSKNRFSKTVTEPFRAINVLSMPVESAWFWETREHGLLFRHQEVLMLGEDIPEGPVTITLKSRFKTTVYVYGILVGQAADEPANIQRFWIQDDLQ
jgi:hypothetical protein